MTPDALMAQACETLQQAGIMGARGDAQKIWRTVWPHEDDDLTKKTVMVFLSLVDRRANREPMSHLIGLRDFYDHRFIVSSKALDPRPDTETLVALALDVPFKDVLDLGTGTGCILLSLLAARGHATGLGVDLSKDALQVAAKNLARLKLEDRCELRVSNWFADVSGAFDLIVSNPPYIAAHEMDDLQPEVRLFEPRIALTDEADGLTHYRDIIANHDPFLRPGGRIMMEIGPTQGQVVCQMMVQIGLLDVTIYPDLDGRDRVVAGCKPS